MSEGLFRDDAYLFYHKATQAVTNKYYRSAFFLNIASDPSPLLSNEANYRFTGPCRLKCLQEILGKLKNRCIRVVVEQCRIIAVCKYPRIRHIFWKKIPEPHCITTT